MEEKKSPKVEAFLASLIDVMVQVDDRKYNLLIPNGVSYEEAEWVCQEMGRLVAQLKDNSNKAKQEKETLEPEIVSK